MSRRGKFIVIYGINNIGKSTQAKLLVEAMQRDGGEAVYVKYPLYNMEPSRSMINNALRKGNPDKLTDRELQIIFALNRSQFAPVLESYLSSGQNVVAEDYVGTSIAWGVATGVDRAFLERLNSHLTKEDKSFLLDGEPFANAEKEHKHEGNRPLTDKAREIHLGLAKDYGWQIIEATLPVQTIHKQIYASI